MQQSQLRRKIRLTHIVFEHGISPNRVLFFSPVFFLNKTVGPKPTVNRYATAGSSFFGLSGKQVTSGGTVGWSCEGRKRLHRTKRHQGLPQKVGTASEKKHIFGEVFIFSLLCKPFFWCWYPFLSPSHMTVGQSFVRDGYRLPPYGFVLNIVMFTDTLVGVETPKAWPNGRLLTGTQKKERKGGLDVVHFRKPSV